MFRTIQSPIRIEIDRIKASRFIADAAPAESAAAARTFVESIAATFPDATHHCHAWRIDGDQTRAADDGEPGGTAGRPILNRILSAELERTVVVVTRYYGGTKLGTGGLIRAYGAAAAAVLEAATIVERAPTAAFRLAFPYEFSGAIKGVLAHHKASELSAEYGTGVEMVVRVNAGDADAFITEVSEATAGRVAVEPADDG